MNGTFLTCLTASLLPVSLVLGITSAALGQPTWPAIALVSVGTDGTVGNNGSGSNPLISPIPPRTRISTDDRFIVFESNASNLICVDIAAIPLPSSTHPSRIAPGSAGNLPRPFASLPVEPITGGPEPPSAGGGK